VIEKKDACKKKDEKRIGGIISDLDFRIWKLIQSQKINKQKSCSLQWYMRVIGCGCCVMPSYEQITINVGCTLLDTFGPENLKNVPCLSFHCCCFLLTLISQGKKKRKVEKCAAIFAVSSLPLLGASLFGHACKVHALLCLICANTKFVPQKCKFKRAPSKNIIFMVKSYYHYYYYYYYYFCGSLILC